MSIRSQYTVRDWAWNHPNIILALLAALYVWMCLGFVVFLDNEQWGWAAAALLAAIGAFSWLRDWWRKTQ